VDVAPIFSTGTGPLQFPKDHLFPNYKNQLQILVCKPDLIRGIHLTKFRFYDVAELITGIKLRPVNAYFAMDIKVNFQN